MDKTFISYARTDLRFAKRLLNALHNRGINPWFDMEDLNPAAPWSSEMLLGVQFADNMVFVITPDSVSSDACNEELQCALRHEKRLIPILRRDTGASLVPKALRELQWIFFRDSDDFNEGLGKLIQVIESPKGVNPLSDRISAQVEVIDEEGIRVINLQRESYIVGRQKIANGDCGSIEIYDKSRKTSRRHLKLIFENGYWIAKDESRNGIIFFPPCPGGRLKDGTKIFLGDKACLTYKEIKSKPLPLSPADENPTIGIDDVED